MACAGRSSLFRYTRGRQPRGEGSYTRTTWLGPKRLWIIIVNIIIIIIVVVVVVVAVRIPQNWAEPEECGRRRANIGWSEPRLPNSLKPLQVSKCVHNYRSLAAAGTLPGFRRDSTQNCFDLESRDLCCGCSQPSRKTLAYALYSSCLM